MTRHATFTSPLITDHRFVLAALIGIAGGAVAFGMGLLDRHLALDAGFVRAASAGAFMAGLAVAGGFGHRGVRGCFAALAAFVGATLLGAMLGYHAWMLDGVLTQIAFFGGGTGVMPGYSMTANIGFGTGFAPVVVFASLFEYPTLGMGWLACAACLHLLGLHFRTDALARE